LRIKAALETGDEDMGFMPCGQVCGRIHDIPTVQELIDRIIAEAENMMESIGAAMKS
jgi:nitronate monooxygenase